MKKLFSLLLILTGVTVWLQAETVSSVSFNPSRMGEYTYLKVADKANLKGGLNATTLNISSGGTVSMTTDSSSRVYQIDTVTGAANSSIDMPNTAFHGNTANTYSGYDASSSSVPSGLLPTVKVLGGTQQYNNDSYLATVDAVNMLKQRAGTLKGGTLTIGGNESNGVTLYGGDSTLGFHLAGNDIPVPTAAHTNTGKELSNCTLAWEKRKTNDSPAKEVWVLALTGCGSSGGGFGPITPPIPPIDPVNPTYVWVLTASNAEPVINPNSPSAQLGCPVSCAATAAVNKPGGATAPEASLPASAFIPECNASNLGHVCKLGARLVPGAAGRYTKYCPVYRCSAR